VCDDNEPVRRLVAAALSADDCEVREAASMGQAREELAERPPDLVILDVHMPGPGGISLLQGIRGDPALATTPVLLVSGSTEAVEAGWAESLGADAFLPKPFALDALRRAVAALLERS
jgi:two-component system, OmpR family, phosphate regulon response regulator PhoB